MDHKNLIETMVKMCIKSLNLFFMIIKTMRGSPWSGGQCIGLGIGRKVVRIPGRTSLSFGQEEKAKKQAKRMQKKEGKAQKRRQVQKRKRRMKKKASAKKNPNVKKKANEGPPPPPVGYIH